jgi:hypothetical protein
MKPLGIYVQNTDKRLKFSLNLWFKLVEHAKQFLHEQFFLNVFLHFC